MGTRKILLSRGIFRSVTDSSPLAQNDLSRRNDPGGKSPWDQNGNYDEE